MPTETAVLKWICENWPSLTLGLSAGGVYAVLYLRLRSFLDRLTGLEKELLTQRKESLLVKKKLAQLARIHCTRHGEDLEKLMKEDDDE